MSETINVNHAKCVFAGGKIFTNPAGQRVIVLKKVDPKQTSP